VYIFIVSMLLKYGKHVSFNQPEMNVSQVKPCKEISLRKGYII
jgi:hypothetical protein